MRECARADSAGIRLDRFVVDRWPGMSRSQAQRMIRWGRITVNGSPARPGFSLSLGDLVRFHSDADDPQTEALPAGLELCILYEDADVLVIDKPVGLVVHSAPEHRCQTLVDSLLAYRPGIAAADVDPTRSGIVHRLDRDTSGLMVVAATRQAQEALQAQFKARSVNKEYQAILYGRLAPSEGAIDAPIGRHPRDRKRMAVVAHGGRRARTEYRVKEYLSGGTWVIARLLTGRTHQLRVHFAAIGHPILGDALYGRGQSGTVKRQMLHAWRLSFSHPVSGQELTFVAELPNDIQRTIAELRGASSDDSDTTGSSGDTL